MDMTKAWRAFFGILCAMAALALTAPAAARTVLELDTAKELVSLQDWGDSWLDNTGKAGPDAVADDPAIAWAPTRQDAVYPIADGAALWIRFTIPPAPDAERWYLEIPSPSVDRVTLYTMDSVGRWSPASAGDRLPVAAWPVPHRHPLLPLAVSAEEPRRYLVRLENPRLFSTPLTFVSERHFILREQRSSLVLGIYFGLAGLTVALALLGAVSARDSAPAYTALAVALMGLTQASAAGIAGLHLWPRMPWWNDISSTVLPILTAGATTWCSLAIVSMSERSRAFYRSVAGLSALCIPVAIAVALVVPSYRHALMTPYVLATSIGGLTAVVWAFGRGDRHALQLLAASLPVFVGALFPLARTLGLLPVSFWTTHALQFGTAIEWPILLMILMLRSKHRRENGRRIQGLDRIDPATGLINAFEFRQRLARVMVRSERLGYQSAVLLVDLVNIEELRRDFDRRAAEEMPLRVAGRLLSTTRVIDSVARLSEHRFGMLVEGPLTPEEVASIGPRVVARCLMPLKNRPLALVARVHTAEALVPLDGSTADVLIDQLQAVLAAVPSGSKRSVFSLSPKGIPPARRRSRPPLAVGQT